MPTPSATQTELLHQLVELTDAVKQLAQRPVEVDEIEHDVSATDRVRQRVSFGYQALGMLTGRVSSASGAQFDLPVVAAARRPGLIGLDGLPPAAGWVELRSGNRLELLRIFRGRDHDRADDEDDPKPEPFPVLAHSDANRASGGLGVLRPRLFTDRDPIGSIVVLAGRRGPLLAFGPRLAALDAG